MMVNFWETKDLFRKFPEAKNLGQLISSLSIWSEEQGRVVCSISINGILLQEEEEKRYSQMKVEEISELCVESETPEGLLDQGLCGCKEHLNKLSRATEALSLIFLKGDMEYAFKYLELTFESLTSFIEAMTYYRATYESYRGSLPETWRVRETKIPLIFNQILEASEKKEYTLVSELLEYEMLVLLEQWRNEIEALDIARVETFSEQLCSA